VKRLARLLAGVALLWQPVPGAAGAATTDPGRLFFTPAQRAQLESVRARQAAAGRNPAASGAPAAAEADAPRSFDGIVIRSDGAATRWVDGKAQHGSAGVAGLKPGQVRAHGKVYEPYQVLRPSPVTTNEDNAP
jgi:hypothetical protein